MGVLHFHRGCPFDAGHRGPSDVGHVLRVPLHHLLPQGLPAVLQEAHLMINGDDGHLEDEFWMVFFGCVFKLLVGTTKKKFNTIRLSAL